MISKKTIKLANKIMKEFDQFNLIDNDSEDNVLVYRYMKGENYLEVLFYNRAIGMNSNLNENYSEYLSIDLLKTLYYDDSIDYISQSIENSVEDFNRLCLNLTTKVDPIKLESKFDVLYLGDSSLEIDYENGEFGTKVIIDINENDLELAKKVEMFLESLKKPVTVITPEPQPSPNQQCWCEGKCSSGEKETAFTASQKKIVESYMNKIWEEIESAAKLCNKK